jgi:hypothetical protein
MASTCLLWAAFFGCGLNAFGATLTPGRDNTTGRGVYSDRWGSTDVHDVNTQFQINLLGTTLALGVMGTNLDVKLMLAIGREMLGDDRTLFLYELDFSIPLNKKLSEVPEFISILSSMYGELDFWRYTRSIARGRQPVGLGD